MYCLQNLRTVVSTISAYHPTTVSHKTMSSHSKWGRSKPKQSSSSQGEKNYVPPALSPDSSMEIDRHGYYVTSPPKQKTNVVGSISTLFRRAGSRGNLVGAAGSSEELPINPKSEASTSRRSRRLRKNKLQQQQQQQLEEEHDTGGAEHQPHPSTKHSIPNKQQPRMMGGDFRHYAATTTAGGGQRDQTNNNRLFYSSTGDGDSDDDSFESRANASRHTLESDDDDDDFDSQSESCISPTSTTTAQQRGVQTILRYRGFSTSIQSLFLDEALVCASMGCFGLLLSNRTEHLLQLRNDRRGVRWGRSTSRRTLPSRIVAYALLLTLTLIAITFFIWGFGSNNQATNAFYDGYDYGESDNYNKYNNDNNDDDDGDDGGNVDDQGYNNNNNDDGGNVDDQGNNDNYNYYNNGNRQLETPDDENKSRPHRLNGIFKIRDTNEALWEPAIDFIRDEWSRPDDPQRYLTDYNSSSGTSNSTESKRDLATDLRLALLFAFLVILGILGRRRRMRTRYYLVRARAQEDHLFYASSGAGVKRVAFQDSREDQYEGACSHTLCGCYPTDPPQDGDEIDDEVQVSDDGVTQQKKKHRHDDCISRIFACLMASCCGFVCKCWFQCLSVCALAQEAREIRLLVPTRYQRVDYITHQPFHEYQKDVNELRLGWLGKSRKKSGIMPHLNALSRLSRYILGLFLICTFSIVLTLALNPRASFSWPDAVILIATFLQSFLVIYLVHWIFHKSDLSLDAVIKFFAAGFLIAVPSSFFIEGVMVNLTLTWAYITYTIGELIKGEVFVNWIIEHYKLLWILFELVNAYIVAAVTEELCKYYTFRCVEHPDLIFLTGLARSSEDERAVQGGTVKYPFSSHQVQRTNKRMGGAYDDDDMSVYSRSSRASHRSIRSQKSNLNPREDEEEFTEDELDVRTHRQKAAAVTTGMICVAVGLACAENFLYVFLLGGASSDSNSDILEEWIVLLFRSVFPVHALAAAMQSVNMIRKFVECEDDNNHRVGVGRIILPAVIMHGSFDAVLLGINVYIETSWDDYLEENEGNVEEGATPYNAIIVNVVAWMSIILVMVGGILWYYRENRDQQLRLILLEEKEKAKEVDSYSNPSGLSTPQATTSASEVELV